MALTWTEMKTKAQRISQDTTDDTLTQLEQDMNTGYHMFNVKLSRYWSRKQQFTDLIAGQQIYQSPIDSVRIIGMTIAVSNTYQIPVKEIRSEFEWRQITAYPYSSNWPAYYYVIGNDEIALWPTPSQGVTNGLRYYYQQDDTDLSVDDYVSTDQTTPPTVTMMNGSTTVTATSNVFTPQMQGLHFKVTGVTDLMWYEIVDVPSQTTLTLKSPFVGLSGSGLSFKIGQLPIFPGEFHDAPVHYALGMFFSAKGNESRAQYHLGTEKNPGMYYQMVNDAIQEYSSSTEGNVITDSDNYVNAWFLTPLPPYGS